MSTEDTLDEPIEAPADADTPEVDEVETPHAEAEEAPAVEEQTDAVETEDSPTAEQEPAEEPEAAEQQPDEREQELADLRKQIEAYKRQDGKLQKIQRDFGEYEDIQRIKASNEQYEQNFSKNVWDEGHPQRDRFLARYEAANQQATWARQLPEEAQTAALQQVQGAFTEQEWQAFEAYHGEMQARQQRMLTDPDYYREQTERTAYAAAQRAIEEREAQRVVQREFDDPALQPVLNHPRFASLLQQVGYDQAKQMTQSLMESEGLKAQLAELQKANGASQERERLRRNGTTIEQDAKIDDEVEAYEVYQTALKQNLEGIEAGTDEWLRVHAETSRSHGYQ